MIVCQLNQVKKEYSGTTVFENISFAIKENECIGLVGRNGSGKTTLLNLIAALEEPDEGIVTHSKECRIGSLAQLPQVDGEMVGIDYLRTAFNEVIIIQSKMKSVEEELSNNIFKKR